MSTTDTSFRKLKSLTTHSLQSLSANIIVKVKDDYIVFNRYKISPTNNGYYEVYRNGTLIHEFTNSRNALAWCILEKNARIEDANFLLGQDKKIGWLELDIDRQTQIMNTTQDNDRRALMATKVTNNIHVRGDVKIKLQEQIELAKYYQQKGFDNETARTSKK
jgi:hypothetical protein